MTGDNETNRALAYRMHAAFNARDFAATDDIFAADFYSHPLGTTGVEHIRRGWAAMVASFPELHTTLADVLVDGDRVAIRATVSGGPARATDDRPASMFEIFRVANGRIAELWGLSNLR